MKIALFRTLPDHYPAVMIRFPLALAALALAVPVSAQEPHAPFHPGPLIADYGPIADVDVSDPLPTHASFKVAFDLAAAGKPDAPNRGLVSLARFLNMHVAAGVPAERIGLAVVVHGPAGVDLTKDAFYGARHEGAANPNADLIAQLQEHGVRVILCGQSAAASGIARDDLLPGVEMALSAMTAHALLQQDGYTLNPF